jgi:hypothetical protein
MLAERRNSNVSNAIRADIPLRTIPSNKNITMPFYIKTVFIKRYKDLVKYNANILDHDGCRTKIVDSIGFRKKKFFLYTQPRAILKTMLRS